MENEQIIQAAQHLQSGEKSKAKEIFLKVLSGHPTEAEAWYGLSHCVDDREQRRECLERTLRFNPHHAFAENELQELGKGDSACKPGAAIPAQNVAQAQPEKSSFSEVAVDIPLQAEIVQKAGKSTLEMARRRRWQIVGIGLIFLVPLLILTFFFSNRAIEIRFGSYGILAAILLLLIVPKVADWFMARKAKESRRALKGAQMEEKVAEILAKLDGRFLVIHDVNCANGNIDHLVLNRNGQVFMIETKSHNGTVEAKDNKVYINGHQPEKDFIQQCLRNSYWLREQIEVVTGEKPWVTPVLVFANAFVTCRKPIKGVMILNKKILLSFIQRRTPATRPVSVLWEKRYEILKQIGVQKKTAQAKDIEIEQTGED